MSAELPESWAVATLGDLCFKSQYGWTTKAAQDGQVRLLRTTDITRGNVDWSALPYCTEAPEDLDKYRVRQGDIFISRAGSVGYSALIFEDPPDPTVFASYLIRFRPVEGSMARFLSFFLQSPQYWSAIGAEVVGIALGNVNAKKLSAVPAPVPPLEEQGRIVELLEREFTRLDLLETELDTVDRLEEQFERAFLRDAFAGRSFSQGQPFQNGEAEKDGARAPVGWEVVTLGALCERMNGTIQTGPFGSQLHASDYTEEGTPVLMPKNLDYGVVSTDGIARIGPSDVARLSRHVVKRGDIVQSRRGDLRRRALITEREEGWLCGTGCFLIRLGDAGTAGYVGEYLGEPRTAEFIDEQAVGVTMPNLNAKILQSIPIRLPPAKEQQAVLEKIRIGLERAKQLKGASAQIRRDADRMRRIVLHKAFAGQLASGPFENSTLFTYGS